MDCTAIEHRLYISVQGKRRLSPRGKHFGGWRGKWAGDACSLIEGRQSESSGSRLQSEEGEGKRRDRKAVTGGEGD